MLQNETALTQIAQEGENRATQLYQLTEPGLAKSEQFYTALSSGDPAAILQAIAPQAQQANQAAAGAKKNLLDTPGGGGEKNLALEMTDVNRGATIGATAGGAATGAVNALGALAGQGVSESAGMTNTAISGESAASSTLSSLGGLQLQDKELQMEQKGQSMGAFGELGQAAAGAIGGAMGGGGWEGALAALAA